MTLMRSGCCATELTGIFAAAANATTLARPSG